MYIEKIVNEIPVLTETMISSETVAINILVKTGSRNETLQNNGISHFLEHMAFKGTKNRTAAQIAEAFDMIGGDFNAYTSREKTVYYAKVLKADLETALDILSDIIQHSVFDQEEIDKEKKVILEELAQTKDDPSDHIFDLFQEKLFQGQALGRSIIGTPEFINNVTRDDLLRYIDERYGRNNCIISCAGNVDSEKFAKLVEEKFNNLGGHSKISEYDAKYTGGEVRLEKDLEQVNLLIGFKGPSYLDEDFYSYKVLSIILGGGMSSRLFQEVREKRGLAYNISTFVTSYQETGVFSIYSSMNADTANELIDVTSEQFKLAIDSIEEKELIRAKAQVRAGILMAQESSAVRSDRLSSIYARFGNVMPIKQLINKIDDVSLESIKKCLKNIIENQELPTVAAIGKLKKLMPYDEIMAKFVL